MTLAELAIRIKATLRGDATMPVSGVSSLAAADTGQVTLLADSTRLHQLPVADGVALIVPPKLADADVLKDRPLLIAENPKLAFARAIQFFYGKDYESRGVSQDLIAGERTRIGEDCSIHPRVTLGDDCVIGKRVTLHPGVVLGRRVSVGDDSILFANVSVYDDCDIGRRCRIHSGTVIGADGFSFTPDETGQQYKLLQVGRVVIEDDVELGANCCVDRAGFGETRIRRGAKFDNLIQIGHNCDIGENTVVAALAGFSGGTTIGRSCIIAGQIGTNQHITIGDNVIVTARTGVTKSVPAGKMVGGMMPAQDYQQWRKAQVLYSRLPELFERIKKLEKKIAGDQEPETGKE